MASISEDIDDLKRMYQWKSLIIHFLDIKKGIEKKLETAWSDEDIRLLAAEYRMLAKILNPLLLPPIDRETN